MDRQTLRDQAASRRNPVEETGRKVTWKCGFCGHDFASERTFMNHFCREKQRHEELRSPIGQAAYAHYSHWMKCQRHSVPGIETFGQSKFYSAFLKFAEFAAKVRLPNVNRFIELMVENGKVPPVLWCRDAVYSVYLKAYDAAVSPITQFTEGLQLLEELALELKVPLKDIFPAIGVDSLEDLIARRKLTFWLLMASGQFRAYLLALPQDDKERLQNALNSGAVLERLNQEADLFRQFVAATKEVGL